MENYYNILGIRSSATAAEIKRSFREKVKKLHPDFPENNETSDERKKNEAAMRKLITAYEMLIDPHMRSRLDVEYAQEKKKTANSEFDYRLWLIAKTDPESRTKLIFFDLFHNLESEAVVEYLRLRTSDRGFTLSQWCCFDEFMDCGFVLAEELYARGEYYEAFALIEEIIHAEFAQPYFKHFFPDVLIFARALIHDKHFGTIGDQLAAKCYEAALSFGLSTSMNTELKKRIAKIKKKNGAVYSPPQDRAFSRIKQPV